MSPTYTRSAIAQEKKNKKRRKKKQKKRDCTYLHEMEALCHITHIHAVRHCMQGADWRRERARLRFAQQLALSQIEQFQLN
jgi:hypothetical protein